MREIVHTSRAVSGTGCFSGLRAPVRAWITYQIALVRAWVWVRVRARELLPWKQPRAQRAWGEVEPLAALVQALVQALGLLLELELEVCSARPLDGLVIERAQPMSQSPTLPPRAPPLQPPPAPSLVLIRSPYFYIRKNIIEKAILRPFMSTMVPLPSVSLNFSDWSC